MCSVPPTFYYSVIIVCVCVCEYFSPSVVDKTAALKKMLGGKYVHTSHCFSLCISKLLRNSITTSCQA